MRSKERITSIRKNMKDRVPREKLWYFNESNIPELELQSAKKTSRYISERAVDQEFAPFTHDPSERINEKDCLFVVDWQMPEPQERFYNEKYE